MKINRKQMEQEVQQNLPKDLDLEAFGRAMESAKPEYQSSLNSLRARPESRELGPEWNRPKEPMSPEQQKEWEQMTREAFNIGPEPKDSQS